MSRWSVFNLAVCVAVAGTSWLAGNEIPACQDINGDGRSDIADAVFFLNWKFKGGPEPSCPADSAPPAPLPATGQTACTNMFGQFTACADEHCPGQDAAYAAGCSPESRFIDNGDGTVTDNCTGLMWQKETAASQELKQVFTLEWCDALVYCDELMLAGHDDWRLPNVRELQSLSDFGHFEPAVDPIFSVIPDIYWTSTSFAESPLDEEEYGEAWYVDFYAGDSYYEVKDDQCFVLAVRGGR